MKPIPKLLTILLAFITVFTLFSCKRPNGADSSRTSAPDTSSGVSHTSATEPEQPTYRGETLPDGLIRADYIDYGGGDYPVSASVLKGGSVAILFRNDTDSFVRIYDPATGALEKETDIGVNYCSRICAYGEGYYITSFYGTYAEYTAPTDDKPAKSRLLDDSSAPVEDSSIYTVFPGGGYIRITNNSGIYLSDDGSAESLLAEFDGEYNYVSFFYRNGNEYHFQGSTKGDSVITHFLIDAGDNNSVRTVRTGDPGGVLVFGNHIFEHSFTNSSVSITDFDTPEVKTVIALEDYRESLLDVSENLFFTVAYDGLACTLRAYDTAGVLRLRREFAASDEKLSAGIEFIACDERFTLINVVYTNAEGGGEESYQNRSSDFCIYTGGYKEPVERKPTLTPEKLAADIEEKYGVIVYTGNAVGNDFPDFVAEKCTDKYTIIEKLKALDDMLGKFPKGFMQELFRKNDKGADSKLIIYFTGTLKPTDPNSTSSPVAYHYSDYGIGRIVIDINYYGFAPTFCHELMHAVDSYININNPDAYAEWFGYVPGDGYFYSYVDSQGYDISDTKYVMDYTADPYFMDSYSRTFPGEDRSRLFENMCFNEDSYPGCFKNERIAARAEYLCKAIRDSFECIKSSDKPTFWESGLEAAR